LGSLFGAAITGAVVAWIAKMILPGKQAVTGLEMWLIGSAAAWLGGFLAGLVGLGTNRGFGLDDLAVLAIQVAIAAVVIWWWTGFRNKQVKKALMPDMPGGGKDGKEAKKDKDDTDGKGGPNVPGVPGI
jgi:uncharacterized membrane protein YeaQ/YmgE (transglycosylase-associated protein family)